jgi:hypothetical protein
MTEKKSNNNSRKKNSVDLDLVDLTPRKVKSATAREISLPINSQNVSRNKNVSQDTSSFDLKTLNEKSKSKNSKQKKRKKSSFLKSICITIVLSIIGAAICFIIALKY